MIRQTYLLSCLAAAALASVPVVACAQAMGTNLGFEVGHDADGVGPPVGWYTGGTGYEVTLDTVAPQEGRSSLRSRWIGDGARPNGSFGVATQRFPVEQAHGRALRLSGWIRTEEVGEGYAGLWMRVDGGAPTTLAFDNMANRGVRGTTSWTRYTIELPVDSGATAVYFGALHPGTGTAWFDGLGLEVVGPERPRQHASVAPYHAPPRPAEDLTRLLTDAELAVEPDPRAPAENETWTAWARANAHPIRSLGATTDFSDLRFLAPLLEGRRIVQLGESGHGVREFNLAKVRLIRFLHRELGYDVIAFESSLFECDRAGRAAATLSALELMRNCIFGVWHTEELLPLFEYIRETQATERPLILSGFDVQQSSAGARHRPEFLRSVVAAADTAYARRVFETDSRVRQEVIPSLRPGNPERPAAERDSLVAFYDALAGWLRERETALAAAFPDDPAAPRLARQTAVSMAVFLRQLMPGRGWSGVEIRDRGMADNLDFLADELYPDRKIMVWAHNFHIRHGGYGGGDAVGVGPQRLRTMGTFAAERRRQDLYTIGFFMYRGSAAHNNRAVYQVAPAAPGSLESILHRVPWRYSFIDLSRAERQAGTEWIFRRIGVKEWGLHAQTMVPRDEYDGIVFVDTTWPPDYVMTRTSLQRGRSGRSR